MLFDLPEEILLSVCRWLTFRDKVRTETVCKDWRRLLHDRDLHQHWLKEMHYPQGAYPLLELQNRWGDIYHRYMDYLRVLTVQENNCCQNAFFEDSFHRIPFVASPHMVNCWKQLDPNHLAVHCGWCGMRRLNSYYCLVRYTAVCWQCYVGTDSVKPSKMCYLKRESMRASNNSLSKITKLDEMNWYAIHKFDAVVLPWNQIQDSYMMILPRNQRDQFRVECMKLASRVPYVTGKQHQANAPMNPWGYRRRVQNRSFALSPMVPVSCANGGISTDASSCMINLLDDRTGKPVGRMQNFIYQYVESPLLHQSINQQWFDRGNQRRQASKGLDEESEYESMGRFLRQSYFRGVVMSQEDLEYLLIHQFQIPPDKIIRGLRRLATQRNRQVQHLTMQSEQEQERVDRETKQLHDAIEAKIQAISTADLDRLQHELKQMQQQIARKSQRLKVPQKVVRRYRYQKRRYDLIRNLQDRFTELYPPPPAKRQRRQPPSDELRCTALTKQNTRCCNKRLQFTMSAADTTVCHIHRRPSAL
jgi:hypothetical protein